MSLASSESPSPRRRLRSLVGSPWLRPLNDLGAIEDLVACLVPTWSFTRVKARVIEARKETDRSRTLVLAPNRLWPGHVAGQHVLVSAEVRGRRVSRAFSLSSPPRRDGRVEITVKRREGGILSAWWNDEAVPGDVVVLGRPSGDFVLPSPLPASVAMLSAGSGITPLMAMLRALDESGAATPVRFEHWASTRDDVIFATELASIARRRPWLQLEVHPTDGVGRPGADALDRLAARCAGAATWLCGPAGFREAVRAAWGRADLPAPLEESFGIGASASTAGAEPVVAATSGVEFEAPRGTSLLAAAEAAGLRPLHGCRAGICHTCSRRLLSGSVVDLRDGRVVSEPGRTIQLCVSGALTPVSLEL